MNLFALSALLAVIIGLSESFTFDSVEENEYDERIVGGQTARPNQFPHQISIRKKISVNGTIGWFYHRCGGSIISRRWIITAAHCTQGDYTDPSLSAIVVGAHHVQNDGQIYELSQVVNHPSVNIAEVRNDISLLRTTKLLHFNSAVQRIKLSKQFVNENVVATVSGWGNAPVSKEFRRLWTINDLYMCHVYRLDWTGHGQLDIKEHVK